MIRFGVLLLSVLPLVAQDHVDLGVVDRIKTEAFDRSQVMDTLYYMSDVHGPRLTGSPEFEDAVRWAVERLKSYGLADVHTERWGPFGRSWSLQQASLEMTEPRYSPLTAVPLAWSAPTNGVVTGELVMAPLRTSFAEGPKKLEQALEEYQKKWSGKLRGKIVLLNEPQPPRPQTNPQFERYTAQQLADIAKAPEPAAKVVAKTLDELQWPENPTDLRTFFSSLPTPLMDQLFDLSNRIKAERGEFFAKEGVVGVLIEDPRSHEGLVNAEAAGSYKASDPMSPPVFVVTAEQYDRIARLVEKKLPVSVRMSVKAAVSNDDVYGKNIIAEIPGGAKKDEVVMVGGHFDSWESGTGATDNGAGSAVMIEAMRILKALNVKLDRTVRLALWSGEEEGLPGSRAYVKQHFADPETMQTKPEFAKLSGYFNLDNGSGKIRGVYLQGEDAMRPVFAAWLAPFRDMGADTITIRNTGGTDHLSFDAVGLPGFQFIQDPLDYETVTHHSDMDTYDHAVPADLMQAAAIVATCVYEAANRPEMLPRRPMPKPGM
jgi:carboxypeptidase Q